MKPTREYNQALIQQKNKLMDDNARIKRYEDAAHQRLGMYEKEARILRYKLQDAYAMIDMLIATSGLDVSEELKAMKTKEYH